MMLSSSKPFGTNCNFLNSVSSSCHEHFESYYKCIFLSNFTVKGAFFIQLFLAMLFFFFFFSFEKRLTWNCDPSPQITILLPPTSPICCRFWLRECFYYAIGKWLCPHLHPLKNQRARNGHICPQSQEWANTTGSWKSWWSRESLNLNTVAGKSEPHLRSLPQRHLM